MFTKVASDGQARRSGVIAVGWPARRANLCRQPIRADIVGVHLQVAAEDIVECNVPPYEAQLRIEVLRHGAAR